MVLSSSGNGPFEPVTSSRQSRRALLMHFEDPDQNPPGATPLDSAPWYQDLSRYHWFVLVVAALGWLFDTMDQQLFNLARKPAVSYLIQAKPGDLKIDEY